MRLVQDADREQEQAGPGCRALPDIEFDIGLFEFNRATVGSVGSVLDKRMFELEFSHHANAVVELMPDKEHETVEVDFVLVAAVVVQFAIATDRGALPPTIDHAAVGVG